MQQLGFAALLSAVLVACSSSGPAGPAAADAAATADTSGAVDAADAAADPATEADLAPDAHDVADDVDTGVHEGLAAWCPRDVVAIEARIDALLAELTVDEKASLLHGDMLAAGANIWPMAGLPERGIPGLIMSDGPRGVNHRLPGRGATAFPVAAGRGATWDPELERRVGEAMAGESRAIGTHVLLAPTMNLLRHPRWGRAQETYGEDPWHVGAMAAALVEGVQSRDVIACAKHFALNSIEDTRFDVDVLVDERALRELYLPHFRRVVQEARVASVMTSYNQVNGAYCSENAPLVRDILKEEWRFPGYVVSDWIFGTHSTVPMLEAGLDVEMPSGQYYGFPLARAVEADAALLPLLDDAVRRVLRATYCFGVDTDPPTGDYVGLESDENLALAREVAARSIVLLENRGLLPLDATSLDRVVVLGRAADVANIGDEGSSRVQATDVVTALDGLRAALPDASVEHIPGTELDSDALAAVAAADLVVVVSGLLAEDEGEGFIAAGDRDSLALDGAEETLIEQIVRRSERVVVVLEGGGMMALGDWVSDVEGLLMAWYPGAQGGHAIADILLGNEEPSGRLPVSWARAEADLPVFDNVSLQVRYDLWHGYWHLDREGLAPLYPFGFGRSYTTFAIEAGEVGVDDDPDRGEQVVVPVTVTNTGDRSGRQTVQIYVRPPTDIERRGLMLVAFAQVELAPGASVTTELGFAASELAVWDPTTQGWTTPAGDYVVLVGASSADLAAAATLTF